MKEIKINLKLIGIKNSLLLLKEIFIIKSSHINNKSRYKIKIKITNKMYIKDNKDKKYRIRGMGEKRFMSVNMLKRNNNNLINNNIIMIHIFKSQELYLDRLMPI